MTFLLHLKKKNYKAAKHTENIKMSTKVKLNEFFSFMSGIFGLNLGSHEHGNCENQSHKAINIQNLLKN